MRSCKLSTFSRFLSLGALVFGCALSADAQFSTIYTFDSPRTSDNSVPNSAPVIDSSGNLYGTVIGNADGNVGGVYELTPSGNGAWIESFYEMTNSTSANGLFPHGLLFDSATGNLYGTAQGGTANCGVVYQLTPPTVGNGTWTETVLYAFPGAHDVCDLATGSGPDPILVSDANGNLYGTAANGGTADMGVVFELSPPSQSSGAWTEQVLYSFQGGNMGRSPEGGLIMDSKGALYGTTEWPSGPLHGTVFKLTPTKSGVWSFQTLHKFVSATDGIDPLPPLVFDGAGALYGTTSYGGPGGCHYGCGTVFQLVPPSTQGGQWTENILYEFTGQDDGARPAGGVSFDNSGVLHGCTAGAGNYEGGTLFDLTPPESGIGPWTFTSFSLSAGKGCAGLLLSGNTLYGTTYQGGANRGGIAFEFVF